MSGVKSSWGSESSKESVQCGYCSYSCRKDNLKQHVQKVHVGKPYKWSRLVPKNQPAIQSLFKLPSDSDPVVADANSVSTKRPHSDEISIPGKAKKLVIESDDVFSVDCEGNYEASESGKVKPEQSVEPNLDVNGNYVVQGIISDLKDIGDTFSSLKTGFENVLTGISAMLLTDRRTENPVTEEIDDDENTEVSDIYNCSKLENLVERISNTISFDQDTVFFKCEICFEKKDPYVRGALCDKTGIFKLDLNVYQTSLTLSPNTQPDCFRNFKKMFSQAHQKK